MLAASKVLLRSCRGTRSRPGLRSAWAHAMSSGRFGWPSRTCSSLPRR